MNGRSDNRNIESKSKLINFFYVVVDRSLRGVGPEKSAGEQPLSAAPQVGRLPPQEQDEPVLRVVEKSQAQRGPAAGPVSASSTGGLEEDFVEVAALRAERARLQAEVESSNLELSKLRENALRMMKICSKFNTVCEKQSQAQEENGASSLTIPNQKVGAARRGSAPAAATYCSHDSLVFLKDMIKAHA